MTGRTLFRADKVGDSEPFNISLATTSFIASCATYANAKDPDFLKQNDVIKALLEDNGFADYEADDDYRIKPSSETAPVGCAHKKIRDGGKEYTLLAILPRSGTYGAEFGKSLHQSNSASDTGDHAGYRMVFCKKDKDWIEIFNDLSV